MPSVWIRHGHKKRPKLAFRPFKKELAATYSRGVYKTTTIGKTVFDGRVRNGNGSDHSFMATNKFIKSNAGCGNSLKTVHRDNWDYNSRVKIASPFLRREEKQSSRTTD
jgi:hypothetical protein